jgi:hypothetical protein
LKIIIKYFCFFCIIPFLFSGCVDDVNYEVPVVNGTVYDINGFQVNNFQISIGDYPIVTTNNNGVFLMENVQKPYNLFINKNDFIYTLIVKYLNLTTEKPVVNSFDIGGIYIRFPLYTTFPAFSDENKILFLKFIGEDSCISFASRINNYHDTIYYSNIYFKPDYKSTRGKLLYLLCSIDPVTDNIVSYDAYAEKDITLQIGVVTNALFSEEEVSFNPPEINTHVNFQRPPGLPVYYYKIYLHFPGKDNNADLMLDQFPYFQTEIIVPSLPGIDYKIKSQSVYSYYTNLLFGMKRVITEPGENISLVHKVILKSELPHEMGNILSDTLTFSADDDGVKGIYVFALINDQPDNKTSIVLTDKNIIKLSDFKSRGFHVIPGERYYLLIVKYPGYNSIDDFASVNFIMDDRYDYIQSSVMKNLWFLPEN